MENIDIKTIVSYLTLLELPLDKEVNLDTLKNQYLSLSKVYHPDTSIERYADGKKFILIKNAYDFLSKNIGLVNYLIQNNFEIDRNTHYKNNIDDSYDDLFAKWSNEIHEVDEEVKNKEVEKEQNEKDVIKMRETCIKFVDKVFSEINKEDYDSDIYLKMNALCGDYRRYFNNNTTLAMLENNRKMFVKRISELKMQTKSLRNKIDKPDSNDDKFFFYIAAVIIAIFAVVGIIIACNA